MKKLLLLFLIVFLQINFISVKAQTYHPFPDSNAVWSEYHQPPLFSDDTPYYYRNAITNKDTVFNTKTYHQIFYSLTDSVFTNPANYYYIGGLRESNKQIFFIQKDSINEYLIYDFSLNVGDTIRNDYSVFSGLYGLFPIDSLFVSDIDSVIIFDGTYRKRMNFSGWTGTGIPFPIFYSQWIEGIGNNMGLLCPIANIPTNGVNNYLVCFKQNSDQIYFNNYFNTCFPIITGISNYTSIENSVAILPNPVADISTIHWNNSSEHLYSTLIITDILGRNVKTMNVSGKSEIIINKNDFTQGLYFARLITAKGENYVIKFIID